jgi:predicted permease
VLRRFQTRRRRDKELARDLEEYLERETQTRVAAGMDPEAARLAARRKLGNLTAIREEVWEMHPVTTLEGVWKDVLHAARRLRSNPMFTAAAVLSLTLGIGANTAMFQLLYAVSFRTLPVPNPRELVQLQVIDEHQGRAGRHTGRNRQVSNPVWERLRDRQQAFSGIFAFGDTRFNLAPRGEVRYVEGLWVSGSFFPVLGVKPALGRLFTNEDDRVGCGNPGAVISHSLWQRDFAGSPEVLQRVINLGPDKVPVIGVAPPVFFGVEVGRRFDVALPICSARSEAPNHFWLAVMGRLRPGWSVDRAAAQLSSLAQTIHEETTPAAYRAEQASAYRRIRFGAVEASTGVSPLRREGESSLKVLAAIAAFVLLIASANLANLMLARATARENEYAVRIAIGGSRARLLQQALIESALLAAAGAAGGIALAAWFGEFIVSMIGSPTDPIYLDVTVDWWMLVFTGAIAVGAGLVFGLAPAIQATRAPAANRMGHRGAACTRKRIGVRGALVAVQVALSFVLLFCALLFSRSFVNLASVDPGFTGDRVLLAHMFFRGERHPPESRPALYRTLAERLGAMPGVRVVATASTPPLAGSFWDTSVRIEGKTVGETDVNQVSSDYFAAMGTRLLAGRDFDRRDTASSPRTAIVTETFAKKYFPGRSPLGRTFATEGGAGQPDTVYEVVGVAEDMKHSSLREGFSPLVFLAASQEAQPGLTQRFVLRTGGAPGALMQAVRQTLSQVDPSASVRFETMRRLLDQSSLRERLMATLSSFFGALACVLAVVGLYGVVSYMVERRRNEIGIRVALGAARHNVVRVILKDVGVLMGLGMAAGSGIALAAGRAAESVLYGLAPHDPATLVSAC